MQFLRKIFIVLVPFLCMSCIWYPAYDYSDFDNKNSVSDFSDLEDPIVVPIVFTRSFKLPGKEPGNWDYDGYVYAVYDWKTDSVRDWLYSPRHEGSLDAVMPFTAPDGNKYYIACGSYNDNISILDAKSGTLKKIKKEDDGFMDYRIADSSLYETRYAVFYGYKPGSYLDGKDGMYARKFMIYDTYTGTFSSVEYRSKVIVESEAPVADNEGNYWFCYSEKSDTSEYDAILKVKKLNPAENTISDALIEFSRYENYTYDEYDGWSGYDDYDLKYVDSDYVVIVKTSVERGKDLYEHKAEKVLFVNKITGDVKEVDIADDEICIDILKFDGKYYAIKQNEIAVIDLAANGGTGSVVKKNMQMELNSAILRVYARENKIIVVTTSPEEIYGYKLQSYNVETGVVEQLSNLTLKSITNIAQYSK